MASVQPQQPSVGEDDFFFRRVFLRIQAKFGVSVIEAVKLSFVPEIEMIWDHQLPQGWVPYNPKN